MVIVRTTEIYSKFKFACLKQIRFQKFYVSVLLSETTRCTTSERFLDSTVALLYFFSLYLDASRYYLKY